MLSRTNGEVNLELGMVQNKLDVKLRWKVQVCGHNHHGVGYRYCLFIQRVLPSAASSRTFYNRRNFIKAATLCSTIFTAFG